MLVKQCHKPPIWIDGLYQPFKYFNYGNSIGDWGFYSIWFYCFTNITLHFNSLHLAFHGDHRPAFHGDFWRVTAPRRWSSVVCAHGAECWWNLSGRCEDFDAAMVAIVADRKTPKKWTKGSIYEDFRRIFFYVAFLGACHKRAQRQTLKNSKSKLIPQFWCTPWEHVKIIFGKSRFFFPEKPQETVGLGLGSPGWGGWDYPPGSVGTTWFCWSAEQLG